MVQTTHHVYTPCINTTLYLHILAIHGYLSYTNTITNCYSDMQNVHETFDRNYCTLRAYLVPCVRL